jgi:hypothetical protein
MGFPSRLYYECVCVCVWGGRGGAETLGHHCFKSSNDFLKVQNDASKQELNIMALIDLF